MTIDPSTLPDGTVTEFRCDGPGCDVSHYSDAPRELFHGVQVVRTFSPDPLPSQEVPRDEWANIKPGSRVRIEKQDGTLIVGNVVRVNATPGEWFGLVIGNPEHSETYTVAESIARVFVLDAPADPDAEIREFLRRMYPAMPGALATIRANGFDVVRAEAGA